MLFDGRLEPLAFKASSRPGQVLKELRSSASRTYQGNQDEGIDSQSIEGILAVCCVVVPGCCVIGSALGLSAFSRCLALIANLLLPPAIGMGCLIVVGGEDLGLDASRLDPPNRDGASSLCRVASCQGRTPYRRPAHLARRRSRILVERSWVNGQELGTVLQELVELCLDVFVELFRALSRASSPEARRSRYS